MGICLNTIIQVFKQKDEDPGEKIENDQDEEDEEEERRSSLNDNLINSPSDKEK